jgi:hypothetical protein
VSLGLCACKSHGELRSGRQDGVSRGPGEAFCCRGRLGDNGETLAHENMDTCSI